MDICGLCPESGSCRRAISEYIAKEVTASWMRAPPESLMPIMGHPMRCAMSMISATFLPNVSPTEPP